jgi:hypothetical protein
MTRSVDVTIDLSDYDLSLYEYAPHVKIAPEKFVIAIPLLRRSGS